MKQKRKLQAVTKREWARLAKMHRMLAKIERDHKRIRAKLGLKP